MMEPPYKARWPFTLSLKEPLASTPEREKWLKEIMKELQPAVDAEMDLRIRNMVTFGTSHPEAYKDVT